MAASHTQESETNLEGNQLSRIVPTKLIERSKNGLLESNFGGNPNLCTTGSCNKKNGNKLVVSLVASLDEAFIILVITKWQDKEKLGSYSTISLQHYNVTDIINEFHKGIDSLKVRIFHLNNKDPHLRIPEGVFTGMKELWVLTLIDIHLSPLPSSIKCLTKLRMLCLERCTLGKKLSYLGELKELRVLNLLGSNIERLPNQLSQLAKLQIFDITNFFELKEIPPDVLSSLTSLEGLYVGNNPIQWNDE
ncbi:hypothetical protein Fmac_025265 [Flemingia macrophylla]|uniref:Disease resistance R13L4/SHOC-2-like LRR domain-containing protein n=1 Tax=Flemingia macrophylla TaxID=520843 RepID=A0ABD1LRQ5_9FABA